MLELRHIRKAYTTGDFTQVALDDVSVTFRDSEFVAVLGPSGSGKTTMLNVLGGLDHADEGDLVINGVSTSGYSAKDWDAYRNHHVGFVFQSYNLIPHQTILSNVELALTLSGVGRSERRDRARKALEQVGLGEHVNKRPAQLSGGQMQRVAIARALVNDPDIVLADEPTGALDTETGIQVMDLLQEVARDRLVVMVTHNPELAEQYATRIVRVRDGRVVGDTDPIRPGEGGDSSAEAAAPSPANDAAPDATALMPAPAPAPDAAASQPAPAPANKRSRRRAADREAHASMSFLTALSLSFNNLMTKKGRTFLVAFAGSIGIIGIAAILALSNGVNGYIAEREESALSAYPLTVNKSSVNMASMMGAAAGGSDGGGSSDSGLATDGSAQATDVISQDDTLAQMFSQVKTNDLKSFKAFLDGGGDGIYDYVNTIQYHYGVTPQVYKADTSQGVVQLNPSQVVSTMASGAMGSALTGGTTRNPFQELVDDQDLLSQQLDVVAGQWPQNANECVLVLDENGQVSDYTLYSIGFYDVGEMNSLVQDALKGNEVATPQHDQDFTVGDALGMEFKVVPASSCYQRNDQTGTWTDMTGDSEFMRQAIDQGISLKVVGVVKPKKEEGSLLASEGIGYTHALTTELMQAAAASPVVQAQQASPDVDVFSGKTFDELKSDQGSQLDMSQLFSVDEGKLRSAFTFDTSALERAMAGAASGSGLDLSGVDLSAAMREVDTSAVQDLVAKEAPSVLASVFDEDTSRELSDRVMKKVTSQLSDGSFDRSEAEAATDKLVGGFQKWLSSDQQRMAKYLTSTNGTPTIDYATAFSDYAATDEGKAALAQYNEDTKTTQDQLVKVVQEAFTQAIDETDLSSKMTAATQELTKKAADAMAQQIQAAMAKASGQVSAAVAAQMSGQMAQLTSALQGAFKVNPTAFQEAIQINVTQDDLKSLMSSYMNAQELSYDANLETLGFAEEDSPESISIYPHDFNDKESVVDIIDGYNQRMRDAGQEDQTIQYSDLAGTLMSSVTDIVNMISDVLIAFVSISLVVSSIMIGVITYISVLERKKEIGILRAMGASKFNVANIFNAETVIEGLMSGAFAVAVVYLVSVPVNAFVLSWKNVPGIMRLPWQSALILIGISVFLTFVAGLVPSMKAARRDPVEALRSE